MKSPKEKKAINIYHPIVIVLLVVLASMAGFWITIVALIIFGIIKLLHMLEIC